MRPLPVRTPGRQLGEKEAGRLAICLVKRGTDAKRPASALPSPPSPRVLPPCARACMATGKSSANSGGKKRSADFFANGVLLAGFTPSSMMWS